jgi:uncharacterized protein (DUF3820 family)
MSSYTLPPILEHLKANGYDSESLTQCLTELFARRSSSKTLNFGKYKGKTLDQIHQIDPAYLKWVARQDWCFPEIKAEITKVLGLDSHGN